MKVNYLQLSNILSFKYEEDINNAFKIEFDPYLSIIIGGNGSGKSTALEAMNFVFTRVLFKYCEVRDYNSLLPGEARRSSLVIDDRSSHISGLRLQPNWNSESKPQRIRISFTLDDIDNANMSHIANNYTHIKNIFEEYSYIKFPIDFRPINGDIKIVIDIIFNYEKSTYNVEYTDSTPDSVQFYLEYYQAINEAIAIHNNKHADRVKPLGSTFSMLSAFRNYNTFSLQTSLQSNPVSQLREIRRDSSYRSNHDQSGSEPAIFNIVKLKLGEEYLNFLKGKKDIDEAGRVVNSSKMVNRINNALKLFNLELHIELTELRTWSYEFRFYDTKNERDLGDINSLSAGQKSIMHLIFEAYGRDDVNGGLIIIDEPEIHLHYQFQFEYLKILEKLAEEQRIQYVIVTHSEGFISNKTIEHVKRFSLDEGRNSVVCAPDIREDQKKLIEILNNTWAARVLFLDRVLLVEGQDDEYFFRAAIKKLQPDLSRNITVYGVRGKDSISSFKSFFESFGLKVYVIKDLDATGRDFYNSTVSFKYDKRTKQAGLDKRKIDKYRNEHPDLDQQIESKYSSDEFYLKKGAIEQYTGKEKGIDHVIDFCENEMDNFLNSDDEKAKEICKIIEIISK
ncbi:AAA family ATPase [Candidatus Nanosynbacter sp. HMT-352]|jgi:Predicted ATP-dependent endonuclease of the OLD family|uniref:AAA family ATPase n=1 Tax=Candidatus Nanosynbacter sp. HMT-352 TaxID=2899133 RepID=UPI001FB6E9CB|nr:AAA family ATPase [Candidatus Nanosynbacter sp. HMT-352]UOG66295.1 AAA family ATPase [Candidatus Nanosynbacter sp. HMT-352]